MSEELTAIKKAMDQMVKVRREAEKAIQLLEEAYALNPIIKAGMIYYTKPSDQTRLVTVDKQTKRMSET